MRIVPASLFDLTSLNRLSKTCFPQDAWPLLDLIAVLTFPGVVRLKALDEHDQMVGFIAGDPRPAENISWVAFVAVLPEYQRKGIGRALMAACEAQLPPGPVRLSVRETNLDAIRLYGSLGYFTVDHWVRYYNDGGNAVIMEKSIDPLRYN